MQHKKKLMQHQKRHATSQKIIFECKVIKLLLQHHISQVNHHKIIVRTSQKIHVATSQNQLRPRLDCENFWPKQKI